MADLDELKQMFQDMREENRQLHEDLKADINSRLDKVDSRLSDSERKHEELFNATKLFVEATTTKIMQIEERIDGVERRLTVGTTSKGRLQLAASNGEGGNPNPLVRFAQDFATGFTGGIYEPKDR